MSASKIKKGLIGSVALMAATGSMMLAGQPTAMADVMLETICEVF
jgi:hypothetical protein